VELFAALLLLLLLAAAVCTSCACTAAMHDAEQRFPQHIALSAPSSGCMLYQAQCTCSNMFICCLQLSKQLLEFKYLQIKSLPHLHGDHMMHLRNLPDLWALKPAGWNGVVRGRSRHAAPATASCYSTDLCCSTQLPSLPAVLLATLVWHSYTGRAVAGVQFYMEDAVSTAAAALLLGD
jgi:hypothetical protein